jgi:hypothetical protein
MASANIGFWQVSGVFSVILQVHLKRIASTLGRRSAVIGVAKDLTKARSVFFVAMAIVVAVTVFVGFSPTFYLRGTFNPDKGLSILLHLHGFALSAGIVLFLVQTILIVRGSPALHRRLNWVMAGLAASIVVLMCAAIIYFRKRPDWHKRLMLSATLLLLGAPMVRIVVLLGVHDILKIMLLAPILTDLLFVPCFIYDFRTRRKVHPAFLVGLGLVMMDQIAQPTVMAWPAWTDLANALRRLVT